MIDSRAPNRQITPALSGYLHPWILVKQCSRPDGSAIQLIPASPGQSGSQAQPLASPRASNMKSKATPSSQNGHQKAYPPPFNGRQMVSKASTMRSKATPDNQHGTKGSPKASTMESTAPHNHSFKMIPRPRAPPTASPWSTRGPRPPPAAKMDIKRHALYPPVADKWAAINHSSNH